MFSVREGEVEATWTWLILTLTWTERGKKVSVVVGGGRDRAVGVRLVCKAAFLRWLLLRSQL